MHIQEVSRIVNWDPEAKPVYPMRPQYEWYNSTFPGYIIAMSMDPAIFERKKDRKGRLAFDQGLERVEKQPATEEGRARWAARQKRKVQRFAKQLQEFGIEKDIDDFMSSRGLSKWDLRVSHAMRVPPLLKQVKDLGLLSEPNTPDCI